MGGALAKQGLLGYVYYVNQASTPSTIYQFRVVLRGVSPLIWRRLLVPSDLTLADLHAILQIAFDWSNECLHAFCIHGKEYGDIGIGDPNATWLEGLRLRRGEKFLYSYDFTAGWECDVRLEAVLQHEPRRRYPACVDGGRAAPPEDCQGPEAYMERLDWHLYNFPIEELRVMTEAVENLLKAHDDTPVREVIDVDELRDAVDRYKAYHRFRPERFDRRHVNAQLCMWARNRGGRQHEDQSPDRNDRGGRPGETTRRDLRRAGQPDS